MADIADAVALGSRDQRNKKKLHDFSCKRVGTRECVEVDAGKEAIAAPHNSDQDARPAATPCDAALNPSQVGSPALPTATAVACQRRHRLASRDRPIGSAAALQVVTAGAGWLLLQAWRTLRGKPGNLRRVEAELAKARVLLAAEAVRKGELEAALVATTAQAARLNELQAELAATHQQVHAAQAQLADANRSLAAQAAHVSEIEAAAQEQVQVVHRQAQQELAATRNQHQQAAAQLQSARGDLNAMHAELQAARTQLKAAVEQLHCTQQELQEAQRRVAEVQGELGSTRSENKQLLRNLDSMDKRLEGATQRAGRYPATASTWRDDEDDGAFDL